MGRITVYVPDELKRRMDALGNEAPVWSHVAVAAFEAKVAEINQKRLEAARELNMTTVLDRLKVSREKNMSSKKTRGYKDGYRWAATRAEVPVLEAVENLPEDFFLYDTAINTYNYAESLCMKVFEDEDCGRPDVGLLLGIEDDKLARDRDYMEGFVDGAIALWKEVEAKL
ncbi:MAG: hypothetical protein IGQ88_11840 [Gloeomargaritaceae cyanobacterium C42_A2020_066]|nr:hypothetical protein [Gloeomargaritaceae cyanobacterium C42_A2020_066]